MFGFDCFDCGHRAWGLCCTDHSAATFTRWRHRLLIDAKFKKGFSREECAERLPPASLTKIMTAYIVEEEIKSGRLKVDELAPISVKAWRTGGSKMFIREGTEVAVGDLLKGIIIQSGNDASVAVAEHIAGSEDAFADMMNQQAVTRV